MPDTRPTMSIFQFLSSIGPLAARLDWRMLVSGAQQKAPFDFLARVSGTLPVHHPFQPSESLQYDEEPEDGCEVMARDEQGDFEVLVSDFDRAVFKVDMMRFGQWLAHKLMKGQASEVAVVDARCVKVLSVPMAVYFLMRSCPADARFSFQKIDEEIGGRHALVLMCEPEDLAQSGMAEILRERSRLRVEPVCHFVQYSERHREYKYSYHEPFVSYLERLAQEPPPGSFLKRPEGMGWKDLELVLMVREKDGPSVYEEDLLFARYRDAAGKTVAHNKAFVKDIPKLKGRVQNGVRDSQAVRFLKALASGASAGISTPSSSKLQTALSRLRDTLCEMFGYFASDDPIPNPEHKSTILCSEFTIRFSDGKSDPLLREIARVDISKRQDL